MGLRPSSVKLRSLFNFYSILQQLFNFIRSSGTLLSRQNLGEFKVMNAGHPRNILVECEPIRGQQCSEISDALKNSILVPRPHHSFFLWF